MSSVPDFNLPVRHIASPVDVPDVVRPEFISGEAAAATRHAEIVDRIITGRLERAARAAAEGQKIVVKVHVEEIPSKPKEPVVRPVRTPNPHFVKASCSWCGGYLQSGEKSVHQRCAETKARLGVSR